MSEDFITFTNASVETLNQSDKAIYDFVISHIHEVKDMSIRSLSHECYVSTSTMFRFVQKLGFSGYADFINSIRLTDYTDHSGLEKLYQDNPVPDRNNYLSLIIHAVRTANNEIVPRFQELFTPGARLILISDEEAGEAAMYAYRQFSNAGVSVVYPRLSYELDSCRRTLCRDDLILFLSLSSPDASVVSAAEKLYRPCHPGILSVTGQNSIGVVPNNCRFHVSCSITENGPLIITPLIAVIDQLIMYGGIHK